METDGFVLNAAIDLYASATLRCLSILATEWFSGGESCRTVRFNVGMGQSWRKSEMKPSDTFSEKYI